VSIALFDAFISCWDEKYRSNLIRPETVINEYVDRDWIPLLQTPPFPEHTSGHSVISTASAEVLTAMLGDNFAFEDDVEVKYGLPLRKFSSFRAASAEAAISRLYGGIHYMPAITEGVKQGKLVGNLIKERLIDSE
jgi:membrane-associated phospholipid phosphatase